MPEIPRQPFRAGRFGKFPSWLFSVAILAAVFVAGQARAEPFLEPGRVEGVGTHFEVSGSPFLNPSVDSTEIVRMVLTPASTLVLMEVDAVSPAVSTRITLSNLSPSATYYKYEDNYHNLESFVAGADGTYRYVQDLSRFHLILLQTVKSTKFISDASGGGDCQLVGMWTPATKTCLLTQDVGETIQIDSDGITLDGNGHALRPPGLASFGVFLNGRADVTLKNLRIESFESGIFLINSDQNRIENNTIQLSGNRGIYLYGGDDGNVILGNIVHLNRIGINVYGDSNVVANNAVTSEKTRYGIGIIAGGAGNFIVRNAVSSQSSRGIRITGPYPPTIPITVSANTVTDSSLGIEIIDGGATIFGNTLIDSGIDIVYAINNRIFNNNFLGSSGIGNSGTGNIFNLPKPIGGNYWSAFDTPAEGCNNLDDDSFCDAPRMFPGGQDNLPWITRDGWGEAENLSPTVADLSQRKSDATSKLEEGATTTEDEVVFRGRLNDPDGDLVKFQVELRKEGQPFSGAFDGGIMESSFVPSWTSVVIRRSGLADGRYHWRARAVDALENASEWQEFGQVGNIDFEVDVLGNVKVAVILAEPSDRSFSPAHDRNYYLTTIIPQARDYWCEVSFGARDNQGNCNGGKVDVVLSLFDDNGENYRLPNPMEYYAKEELFDVDGDGRPDASFDRTDEFVRDALVAANSAINFNEYDAVIVVYPGSYCVGDECLYNSYHPVPLAVSPQETAKNGIAVAENRLVGSWVHELGHAMGEVFRGKPLCDLREERLAICDYLGTTAVKNWDLMAAGSILGNPPGATPAHLSSFSRSKLGWLNLNSVGYGTHTIDALETARESQSTAAFKIGDISYIFEGRTTNPQYSRWDVAEKEAGKDNALVVYKVEHDPELTVVSRLSALRGEGESFFDSLVDGHGLGVETLGLAPSTQNLAFNFQFSRVNLNLARGVIMKPRNILAKQIRMQGPFSETFDERDALAVFTERGLYQSISIEAVVKNGFSRDVRINKYLENGNIAVQRKQPDGSWKYVWGDEPKHWPDGLPEDVTNTYLELDAGKIVRIGVAIPEELGDGIYRLEVGYSFEPLIGLYPDRSKLQFAYSNEFEVKLPERAPKPAATSTAPADSEQPVATAPSSGAPLPIVLSSLGLLFLLAAGVLLQRGSARPLIIVVLVTLAFLALLAALLLGRFFAVSAAEGAERQPALEHPARLFYPPFLKEPIPGLEEIPLDLDLHAYTADGKHVGVNYETGEYENQVPGARASGDLTYGSEWILLPDGIEARYAVSSKDIERFLAADPLALNRLATTTEQYSLSAFFYDAQANKFSAQPLEQTIAPGQYKVHAVSGTADIAISEGVLDTVSPVTTFSIAGTQGKNGWLISDAEVTLSAEDNSGGVGVWRTEYSLDKGETWILYEGPFTIKENGSRLVMFRSEDFVGNREEAKSSFVHIDTTPPEVRLSFDPALFSLKVEGIDNFSQPTVTRNGSGYILEDRAGNTTSLVLEETKQAGKQYKAGVKSIQYGDQPPMVLNADLKAEWSLEKNGVLKELTQQLQARHFKVEAKYQGKKDETSIRADTTQGRGPEMRETLPHLRVAKLVTERGVLTYDILIAPFSAEFNGATSILSAPSSPSLALTSDFTLEAWVKVLREPAPNQSSILVSKWEPTQNKRSYLWLYQTTPSGAKQLTLCTSPVGSSFVCAAVNTGFTPLADLGVNEWHHVAARFTDTTSGQPAFFVDGQNLGGGIPLPIPAANDSPFTLGAGRAATGTIFFPCNCRMDEVRVWNVSRTDDEIAAGRFQELTGNEMDLAGYWRFTKEFRDATPNHNDLTGERVIFSQDSPPLIGSTVTGNATTEGSSLLRTLLANIYAALGGIIQAVIEARR